MNFSLNPRWTLSKHKKKQNFTVFFILTLTFLSSSTAISRENTVLTFGIVPQQSSSKLARKWVPIFQYLSQKTGLSIRFKTAPNIPEFERRLDKKMYDIAYMNPYHYTVFANTSGYQAFAKQKNQQLTGIVVVAKNSPYKNIIDLQNRSLGFPSPAAFAASIITQNHLVKNNITFDSVYVKSHDSVYRSVARNIHAAGGGIPRTFNNLDIKIRSQLRILWRSQPYTPHAFAVLSSLNDTTVATITQAMLMMNNDPPARTLLKNLNFKGFEPATDSDWNDIRALKIDVISQKNQ